MNQNNKRNTGKEKKKENKGYSYKKTRKHTLNHQKKVSRRKDGNKI